MELLSSAVYGAVLFLLLLCSAIFLRPKKYKLPPLAGGGRPIMGHLHLLANSPTGEPPHARLQALSHKHGPIFTINLGLRRAVVVSSRQITKELFTTHDTAVSSRTRTTALRHLTHNFAIFAFTPYGPYWRHLRKLTSAELFSGRRLELMKHVRVDGVAEFIRQLYSHWKDNKAESGTTLVDLKLYFLNLNFDLVARMVTGKSIFGQEEGLDKLLRCREVVSEFFDQAGRFVASDAVPWLSWLDLGGHEKRMKGIAKEFDEIVGAWLSEHRRKKNNPSQEDFLDVMMALSGQGNLNQFQGEYDLDTIIKSTCQAVILGGSDTTSSVLTWAIALLLNHRGALTKAQEELDKHVGRERRVAESDIPNLVYLRAIIKETLRLYSVRLSLPREVTEDINLSGGYHIPKGTWLVVNMWQIHRDPEVWSDNALEFEPDRFMTTHKDIAVNGPDFKLFPFGMGRRVCPGLNLAMQMLHLVLANLLHAFDMTTVNGQPMDLTETEGLTNAKAKPLDALIAPRLPLSLY
ncbi:cytochrome P450 CYP82D47-like [Andrographis paniculata]|uniref:cytochrome P450 CYP82D47-like n=1 Tax=Andrographis paniculata TaxID=175694 RepID=UPI0021E7CB5D|nr:cytochrome P450 CYP82D47-like [Andrographis paniculata]